VGVSNLDKTAAYINELNNLRKDAANSIDAMKDSETLLGDVMKSACEEIRRVYVKEAKNLIDAIAQRKVDEIRREQSRLGQIGMKGAYWGLAGILNRIAREHESIRGIAEDASEGAEMDDINKRRIRQASEIVKSRVEDQAPSMKLDEFMKSLKGGKEIRQSLNVMLREELRRLQEAPQESPRWRMVP
jgi:hypothetical protein